MEFVMEFGGDEGRSTAASSIESPQLGVDHCVESDGGLDSEQDVKLPGSGDIMESNCNSTASVDSTKDFGISSPNALHATVGLVLKNRRVDMVLTGSSADACGIIQAGDVVVAVNGSAVTTSSVGATMRGEAGTSVTLTLEHPGGEEFTVTLTRTRLFKKDALPVDNLLARLRAAVVGNECADLQFEVETLAVQLEEARREAEHWRQQAEASQQRCAVSLALNERLAVCLSMCKCETCASNGSRVAVGEDTMGS